MNRQARIWISAVAGMALVVLVLLAAGATASSPPSVTSATQPQAVHGGGWGSSWVPITQGEAITFSHNLGGDPDDYAVELRFLDTDGGLGINRRYYGGLEDNGNWYGAHWQNLTTSTIQVYRQISDTVADRVRLRVWVPAGPPDFDSRWTDIITGQTIVFSHNVGITATDLTVSLWFSSANQGIHNFGYGGLAVDTSHEMHGAHWHDLTSNTVQVTRHISDTDIEQVRVVVVHGATPDYDSLGAPGGWQPIAAGTRYTFTHGLNWDPNMLMVRGECFSPTIGGISQWFAGGNHDWFVGWQGTNLENLTGNTVQVYRQADDQICPQVRIRIWKRSRQLYLPLAVRNY
ncbi:MAG: hypothetical protein ACE5OS_12935 [Anaerolineae bacterium]